MEDQKVQNEVQSTASEPDWKHHLTTVTPLSKALAILLFVTLPFIGFWFGVKYGAETIETETLEMHVKGVSPLSEDRVSATRLGTEEAVNAYIDNMSLNGHQLKNGFGVLNTENNIAYIFSTYSVDFNDDNFSDAVATFADCIDNSCQVLIISLLNMGDEMKVTGSYLLPTVFTPDQVNEDYQNFLFIYGKNEYRVNASEKIFSDCTEQALLFIDEHGIKEQGYEDCPKG